MIGRPPHPVRRLAFIAALGYEGRPAARVAESLATIGYDAVEWTMAQLDDLGAGLALPACALACQQDLVGGGVVAVETTIAALHRAHELEIPIVDVVAGPNLWEPGALAVARDDEEAWSIALGGLERICAVAEPLGVRVGFEPCWGTLAADAAGARRVLDAVPVALTFDPSHFVMTGDDIPGFVREHAARLAHVHLKDAFGRPGLEGRDFIFCQLGEGLVPWDALLAALDEVGYDGALSIEYEAYGYYERVLGADPDAAARLAAEQARALVEGARVVGARAGGIPRSEAPVSASPTDGSRPTAAPPAVAAERRAQP